MASKSLARWPVIDPVIDGAALGPQIASRMPAGLQRHYRHRHVFVHCGQSLQSMIPSMIIEPAATITEQIPGKSSRTARTAARPLWFRAKRQPATPIRKLRLTPGRNSV
jgi:hypothetical protein